MISAEIDRIDALPIVAELEERQAEAQQIKDATLYQLHQKLDRAKEHDAERARIAEEEEAKREAEREAYAAKVAEQAATLAKQEAEQKANAQLEEQQRAHQAQIEALQRKEREAETARWEAERYERRAAEAKAQAEREGAAAQHKRQQLATETDQAGNAPPSRDQQARIHREVLADLCDLGIHEATARVLIAAIARGGIAHLTITY